MENFFNGQSSTLVSQQNLDIFNNLINHYFNKNPTYYPLEGYTSSNVENNTSFNSFCKTKTKIIISLDLLYGDYVCLSKHFISNKFPVNIILISNIMQLFTECTTINILACNRIQLSSQYISKLIDENRLMYNNNSKLKHIIFTDIRSDATFDMNILDQYKHKYNINYNHNNNTLTLETVENKSATKKHQQQKDLITPSTHYDQTFKQVSSLFDNFINGRSSALVSQQHLSIINKLINQNNYNTSFSLFCANKSNITISLDLFYGEYASLSHHFISNSNTILLPKIIKLFPQCTEINILADNRIELSTQYLSIFIEQNISIWNKNNQLNRITFTDIRSDPNFTQNTFTHYQFKFKQLNYDLKYSNNTLILETLQPTINKEETETLITDIYKDVQQQLGTLLGIDGGNMEHKTSTDLLTECTICISDTQIDIYNNCESIKRLIIILTAYKKLLKHGLCDKISFVKTFTFKDIYTLTEIHNDFFHIKDHFDGKNTNEMELHQQFRKQFSWKDLHQYKGFRRFRNRNNYSYSKFMNDDIDFREIFDKIYSYLTCFQGLYCNDQQNKNKNTKTYIGKAEDDTWWNYEITQEMDEKDCDYDYDENIYFQLVRNMGIFRWQSSHGFTNIQHQGLMHLKPRYTNIKQEVLNNSYCKLSKENWNQTLRKSQIFEKSFASKRIKTAYKGKYEDMISGKLTQWDIGKTIEIAEIVTFKLYTDFDKLQFELKKCFRFETMNDIFTLNNFDPKYKMNSKCNIALSVEQTSRFLLEERLCAFYWWRINLLTVLNKYAQKLDDTRPLYQGVNAKMIINKERIQPFYGPLSVSTSYHVARTFATGKGMVLEVTTQFPRLGFCKGFDASLISDYPEEKEWMISFVYLRIKTIFTRPVNKNSKNWKTLIDVDKHENDIDVPLASKTRSIFFAIHLFRQQIFSMSVHLEYWLTSFLYLCCGYNESCDNKDNGCIKNNQFVNTLLHLDIGGYKYSKNGEICDQDKYNRILSILKNKFNNFRKYPNQKQVIKIDQVSENIKPYFMDYNGLDIYNNDRYVISFDKIVKIFENVKEIHFINMYSFDDETLSNLVQFLFKNPATKVKVIKFLYYDYDKICDVQYEPNTLNNTLMNRLKNMKWNIVSKSYGNASYEIKIFNIGKKTNINPKNFRKTKKIKTEYEEQFKALQISYSLTQMISTGITQDIQNIYSYMIKASSLHKCNTFTGQNQTQFKIFDYDFNDISTDEKLYFVAKNILNPAKERRFKWKLMNKIFNANDIKNEFNISKHQLPDLWKHRTCFQKQLHKKHFIINLIKNQKYMQQLIRKAQWHRTEKIPVYNKHYHIRRVTYSIEKKEFVKELIEFMENNKGNVNLIPVLIKNKNDSGHHVEFMQIVTIKYKEEKCDIALSYQYESSDKINIAGIYVDKYFISSQHQLISDSECGECKCLNDFKSPIDHLTIGDPDYYKNNMNRYKNDFQKQKEEIKQIKKKLKPAKLKISTIHNILYQSDKYDKSHINHMHVNEDDEVVQNSKQLNLNAPEFIPINYSKHSKSQLECIIEETKSEAAESIHSEDELEIVSMTKTDTMGKQIDAPQLQSLNHRKNIECMKLCINNNGKAMDIAKHIEQNVQLKVGQALNDWYLIQTLNPNPAIIIPHPIHTLPISQQPVHSEDDDLELELVSMTQTDTVHNQMQSECTLNHRHNMKQCVNNDIKATHIAKRQAWNDWHLIQPLNPNSGIFIPRPIPLHVPENGSSFTSTNHASNISQYTKKLKKKKSSGRLLTNQFKRKYDKYAVYNPTNKYRAKGNIQISRELTQKIPTIIAETLFDVFSYIDNSTALHKNCYYNYNDGEIRIFNYGFHDKITGNELYCLARKQDKTLNRGYEWKMENKLFTSNEINSLFGIFKDQLPRAITIQVQSMVNINHIKQIQTIISEDNFMNKIKWNKLPVYSKQPNRRKYRTMLSLTVEEFRRKFVAKTDKNIVPILLFEKQKTCVQYIWIGSIVKCADESTDVAISFMYNDKQKIVMPVGIHLDKEQMLLNHQLVYIQDTMNDLDDFESHYCDLQIGNVDENENIIKRLQKENDGLKKQVNILVQSSRQIV